MDWRKNLGVLAFGAMLSSSSYTMVIPFLPLYLLDLGVSPAAVNMWSGVVFAATFFVAAILAPYWGRRADKSGKRRMVMRAGFSLAVVYLLGAVVRTPFELLIMRVLQGFANGFVPASMAIVASSAPQEKMGFSLGLMQTALLIGGILGPLAGGVLSHLFGMRLSFVISGIAIFLGTMAVRALVKEPAPVAAAAEGSILEDVKLAFQNRRLVEMLLLLFIVQAAIMILQPLITLYVAELQGQRTGAVLAAGVIYSLAGIAGAIAAPLWGKIGQNRGFFKILIIAFSGAGVFTVGQFLVSDIYRFSLLQFLFGLFIVGVYPAINTIAVSSNDARFQGRVFGLTTTANQLGSMAGPLIGGMISSWIGIRPVFLITGSLLLLVGLFVSVNYFQGKLISRHAD
ncbi:putative membrane protein [Propionispora sp. 2/2-37]|uniref:MFS transporter n=1 Tax=Propionispora sp. 2/2-37 TaxID=1677858 RepID=UPI0006BB6893|nr:MFS transporter [Propionispora sp. 2/2-37]CUH96544.1 putative membrane protein [Propionispora sp. 2/2-37]